ncbi:tRNA pseudouridine(55) synthase TruB [Virgibacillus ihumii]|uniref:tRNA pseudouridine(55) synthase TruB n=1 Tax=Virgibacillus ihumii TaxID=2686091 RepID=UPI00157E2161|nr:tRNA pseudouridine(55) synthase TruB [Virgibacillus ihumii]
MKGILPLWKPKGMTSHDCVAKVRKLFYTKKVGHTGTLDPEVEGVLPICIGQATKIVPFLTDTTKTYKAVVSLGTATDTEDAQGSIIEKKAVGISLSKQILENVLQLFLGEIEQIPPMYSAVKVNGKKLYEYARANEDVERPVRNVTIHKLDLLDFDNDQHRFTIQVVCSKGTYIRTLCVDIGRSLGYPAHMSYLVRTETGSIMQKDTVSFNELEQAGERQQMLLPVSTGLKHLDVLEVDENMKMKVKNGQKLALPEKQLQTDPFTVMFQDDVLAIYQIHPDKPNCIKPVRVFNE